MLEGNLDARVDQECSRQQGSLLGASKHATVEELVYLTCATRGCLGFVAEALDLDPTRRVATANERLH
jgi:hypothetical protein